MFLFPQLLQWVVLMIYWKIVKGSRSREAFCATSSYVLNIAAWDFFAMAPAICKVEDTRAMLVMLNLITFGTIQVMLTLFWCSEITNLLLEVSGRFLGLLLVGNAALLLL
jgi:hypothetical protein